MKHSRSEPSRLRCPLHLDYRARTGKLPEAAAILTGTLPETGNERNALSLTGGKAETERRTGTGMLCHTKEFTLNSIFCIVAFHNRSKVCMQAMKQLCVFCRLYRSSSGRDTDRHRSSSDRASHRSRDSHRSSKDSRDRHRSRSRDR